MDEIVERLWRRDETALTLMEHRYGGLLQNVQDAEEALNDLRQRIWDSIPPAKPRYFQAYLAKTARNTALHRLEREQAQKRSGITVLLDELAECIPDPAAGREQDALLLRDTLNRFVRSLHGEERSIFLRRYFFGESLREIAAAHRCSENRAAVVLYRTRNKLRELLKEEGYTL